MALQVFGLDSHLYFQNKSICIWSPARLVLDLHSTQATIWRTIHSEIFMSDSESCMGICWSRPGSWRAEVSTRDPDMNNDESLCLTLKLRRGLKKELNTSKQWPVEVGRTTVDCTDQGGLGEIESSRHPMSQQWTLEPLVSQRAAIETHPKAHSRGVESLTHKIGI